MPDIISILVRPLSGLRLPKRIEDKSLSLWVLCDDGQVGLDLGDLLERGTAPEEKLTLCVIDGLPGASRGVDGENGLEMCGRGGGDITHNCVTGRGNQIIVKRNKLSGVSLMI